mgnify:CR=1 FL=1
MDNKAGNIFPKINEIKKSGKYNILDDINLLKRGIKNVVKKS